MHATSYTWAIIGAGPAGIAAIGNLLDQGIDPKSIVWIDPEFNVGDFGTKWRKVSSNTRVKLFIQFYEACHSFGFAKIAQQFAISKLDPQDTCELSLAAEPLLAITEQLKNTVQSFKTTVQKLKLTNRLWEITLADSTVHAKNVILATGAEPKYLTFPSTEKISLETALDPDKLAKTCTSDDTIAVIGSSHSAIIILKTLIENTPVKKVINFYLSPLRYAVYLDDWILFDDTGLKGKTAEWARTHLNGVLPAKLQRLISNNENQQKYLSQCNKSICATGFQKRLITIDGMPTIEYNDRSGIIAPGLFGCGIGFPEANTDRFGNTEYRVGLWKFMEYITRVLPVWMQYGT